MKKILVITFIILFSAASYAQYQPTEEDLKHFFTTKTYVVLKDNPLSDYNFEIEEVMKNLWDMTDYDFIKMEEFPEKSQNPDASFLYTSLVNFEKDRTDSRYVFLHLSLGGPNLTMDDLKDLVSVPLGYVGVDEENYIYKLGVLVQFMQKHVKLMNEKPEIISNNVFNYYNKNIESAHSKRLYILKDELESEVNTTKKIADIYPYEVKLAAREEIRQSVIDQDEEVVFLHKVGPEGKKMKARCYKILIGAGDSDFYYFDYHMVNKKKPDRFLKSDFRKLAR